jgi:hypothetical protein
MKLSSALTSNVEHVFSLRKRILALLGLHFLRNFSLFIESSSFPEEKTTQKATKERTDRRKRKSSIRLAASESPLGNSMAQEASSLMRSSNGLAQSPPAIQNATENAETIERR